MPDQPPAVIYKLSSIFASTRANGTESFDSLDDMPPVMRAECVRALESDKSATVLIADAAGRAYLERLLARQPAQAPPAQPDAPRRFPWRLAVEIVFAGAAGLALWLLATLR